MSNTPKFVFVDRVKYDWDKPTISGAELRTLAAVPQSADIYLKVPGGPDKPVGDADVVVLADIKGGTAHFSTQARGSQAG